MFCPSCKTLLTKEGDHWVCRKCGKDAEAVCQNIQAPMSDKKETVVLDGDLEVQPRTKAECPKCGHNEAFFTIRQTRSSDEPETRIYRCCKCKATWREY
jgi:DNA-directed RNA polymerase subunit M